MKKFALAAAVAAALPAAAFAQDTAPDGSKAFGFEPYVGVLGGYNSFDRDSKFGRKAEGALVDAIAGVNVPLGPLFAGVEGNVGKGFNDLNWEYGVKGRGGFRAGASGLLFLSAGYQWTDGRSSRGFGKQHGWVYGGGVELGPKDIGLSGVVNEAGPRLRLQVDTQDMKSLRPMAGVLFHF